MLSIPEVLVPSFVRLSGEPPDFALNFTNFADYLRGVRAPSGPSASCRASARRDGIHLAPVAGLLVHLALAAVAARRSKQPKQPTAIGSRLTSRRLREAAFDVVAERRLEHHALPRSSVRDAVRCVARERNESAGGALERQTGLFPWQEREGLNNVVRQLDNHPLPPHQGIAR